MSALRPILNSASIENVENIGVNPGHLKNLDVVKQMARKRKYSFIRALKKITKNKNMGINFASKLFPRKLKTSRKTKCLKRAIGNTVMTSAKSEKSTVFAWVN